MYLFFSDENGGLVFSALSPIFSNVKNIALRRGCYKSVAGQALE